MVRAGLRACDAGELTRHGLEPLVAAAATPAGRLKANSALDRPHFVCVAAGKAAGSMARAAAGLLRERLRTGLIVAPVSEPFGNFEAIAGGHPVPTEDSERAGRRALAIAESLKDDEALLVLLSGGASALMAAPAEGVSLEDKRRTTAQLLRAGADIHALNTVRKHLSAIKGGWLASRAAGPVRTFVISDVVGDDPSVIASGPTVPDASTFGDARQLLDRYGGAAAFPDTVVVRLDRGARGELPETPKPVYPHLVRSDIRVIGTRRNAMLGVAGRALGLGYEVVRIDDAVVGEARTAAVAHLRAVLASAADRPRPLCVISTGETTVAVKGSGKGGRNQEFALAAAEAIAHAGGRAVLASIGTDGVDGPTDAAGAIADSTTLDRARTAGLAPDRFLSDNNAYAFFDALGDLIHTGPTGTNVGDLQVILLA
jgi:glycerate 2-kinase